MIVELDPEGVRGYGVYPGGQSGNPGSKTYDAFVETWRTGELYELEFLREEPQNSQQSGPSSNEWQPSWVLTLQ
jgi:penicillin amidase